MIPLRKLRKTVLLGLRWNRSKNTIRPSLAKIFGNDVGQVLGGHQLLLVAQLHDPFGHLAHRGFVEVDAQRFEVLHDVGLAKLGKPLTAKDLSAAKQMAEIIDRRKERMIIDCIEALEAAE